MSTRVVTRVVAAAAVMSFLAGAARAQEDPYLEAIRAEVAVQKTEIMQQAMMLTDEQADLFWPIYNQYMAAFDEVGRMRQELGMRYYENQESMTPELANELIEGVFQFEARRDELLKTYYQQVAETVDAVVAARFVQVERHLQMLIDVQIANEMPLIGIVLEPEEKTPNQ